MKSLTSDLGQLAGLPADQWDAIEVYDLEVTDFAPLGHFRNLRKLGLDLAPKKGITLADFPRLEMLSFDWCGPAFWVTPPKSLETLLVGNYRFKDLALMAPLENLKFLQVDSRTITTLVGLENCLKIEELQILSATKLASVGGLEPLGALKKLYLSGARPVADLAFLRAHPQLRQLVLHNCGTFASLEPIAALENLESLELTGDTKIADEDVGPLFDLPGLRRLVIDKRGDYQPKLSELRRHLDEKTGGAK